MILSSWDPMFMSLGLLGAGFILGDRRWIGLASAYLAAAVAAFFAIQMDSIPSYPALFADLAAAAGDRMGLRYRTPAVGLDDVEEAGGGS